MSSPNSDDPLDGPTGGSAGDSRSGSTESKSAGSSQRDSDAESGPDERLENHDELGLCPFGHDLVNRDCTCTCDVCPRNNNEISVDRQIAAVITAAIQNGNFDDAAYEAAREDHGVAPLPTHDEEFDLPLQPMSFAAAAAAGLFFGFPRLPAEVVAEMANAVSGFETKRIQAEIPPNREDHHNLTIAFGQRPCTELIPWDSNVINWTNACPNDRRGEGGVYMDQSWPCLEENCGEPQNAGDPIQRFLQPTGDRIDDDSDADDMEVDELGEEDPPGDPGTHNSRRWICNDHRRDTASYWVEEGLLQSHRVSTCNNCRSAYRLQFPGGNNTCTCRELLRRWQCRRCYEKKVRKLQTDFRRRIGAHYTGEVDFDDLKPDPAFGVGLGDYHINPGWRDMRRTFVRQSPCFNPGRSRRCGRRRVHANTDVLHCRSCGGVVVAPARLTRSTRAVAGSPLQQLAWGGRGRRGRGGYATNV